MKKRLLIVYFLVFALLWCGQSQLATAQNNDNQSFELNGHIHSAEEQEPLVGANILIKGTDKGAVTDEKGHYKLSVSPSDTLVIRFVGYEPTEVAVANIAKPEFNISLKTNGLNLNPVVISASRRKEKVLDAPASISLIEPAAIQSKVAVSSGDLIKEATGVDMIKSGLQSSSIAVRGFNNVFNASVLTLVDNRIANIPSLRTNAYQMLPITDDDVARIEVLRGPASALYGPNSGRGVVHVITKSPIDEQGTKVSWGMGFRSQIKDTVLLAETDNPLFDAENIFDRSVMIGSLRHSGLLSRQDSNLKVGYKISAKYFTGHDWLYNDPFEPDSLIFGRQSATGRIPYYANGEEVPADSIATGVLGDYVSNARNNVASKYSVDGRIDLRYKDDLELIFTSGLNNITNVELSPVGAGQFTNWKYWYAQTRLRYKNLFAQFFVNGNDSGDTFILRSGDEIIERSRFMAAQVQHSFQAGPKWNFVYGLDALLTRTNTEGTVSGSYEDKDDVNEYGAYLQSKYELSRKLTLLAATRVDYHSVTDQVFVSPRAAILYKPNAAHNFRITYNRAFESPGSNSLFLDLKQPSLPTGIGIQTLGNLNGYNYSYNTNPYFENERLPQFRTPFGTTPTTYYDVGNQSINNGAWQAIVSFLKDEFISQLPDPSLEPILNTVFDEILPSEVENVGHEVKDLNLTTTFFDNSDWKNVRDIEPLGNMEHLTYELGYKGIVGKNLFVTIDAYRTHTKGLIAPTILVTPSVLFDLQQLNDYLAPNLQENLANSAFTPLLVSFLDGTVEGAELDGEVDDELLAIIEQTAERLPIGTITPQEAAGSEILITSTNVGALTVYGLDLSAAYYLNKNLKFTGSYSYVSKDSIPVEGVQFGYVALNAPKHKVGLGVNYNIENLGLRLGTRFRWYDDHPANSGVYVGHINERHEMDLDVSWNPTFHQPLNLTLSIQNLYNNAQQHFAGSPQIGRLSMLRLSYTL